MHDDAALPTSSKAIFQLPTRNLLLLSSPFTSVQLIWVLTQAFGPRQLRDLGFTESGIPMVLLAGPIAGAVVPPLLAVSSNGSRGPWIIAGVMCVMTSLMGLAWAKEIGLTIAKVLGYGSAAGLAAKITAVITLYVMNIAMQPVLFNLRALLMDLCPLEQQAEASLWITRYSTGGSWFDAIERRWQYTS
ncbi:uncharacterized protein PgNI_06760 [Pyricularia grisea]|uniref:Uncharacterized protein n=1 Tax=Pyricularia grisea TaxID=148305 RepID=A0A6P8B1P0_PYRGI|nr:uncharacterized protein PgNI_06760 [Pyricularia grisea]TLD08633.1 hypothetical protein PgNI_06760 [Pyricularia grisea]